MMTDKSVYSDFVAHTIGNWHQSAVLRAGTHTTSDLLVNGLGRQGLPVFSSLGYSRLSVGNLSSLLQLARFLKKLSQYLRSNIFRNKE